MTVLGIYDALSYCAFDGDKLDRHQSIFVTPKPGVLYAFHSEACRDNWVNEQDSEEDAPEIPVRERGIAKEPPTYGFSSEPKDGMAVSPGMMDELRQEAMREDTKRSQLAIQLLEGLGLGEPLRENPTETVVYHAQATMFIRALELMIRRGMAKGHSFKRVGWAGSLLDMHKKLGRLMHVGWYNYQEGDMLYIPNDQGMISDEDGAWGDAVDLLNHTGFFMQCLQGNNRLGKRY